MGLIYSVSVLFFTFMIFRMYLKKDIRPYMTSRVVTLLTILGLLPYVNTVIIIATLGDAAEVAIIKKLRDQRIDNAEQYRMAGRQDLYDNEMAESLILNEFLPEVPDDKVLALGLVEVCALQGCEDGPKIPKSKMGIIIKELKAMFPAADGKQIADLVKSCVV